MLENKNILLISPEPWAHLFVSKHHYAIHLGRRNNKVFFLNPPSSFYSIHTTDYENVYSVHYKGFPRGLRFYPFFIKEFFIRKIFYELQHQCGTTFDIVWSFDNSVFFDFSALPEDVTKICHIVDLNQDFQFKKAVSTADYCFCPSEVLRKKIGKHNSNTYKISHGYAVPDANLYFQVHLPGRNRIKVFYAGNLDIPYIDWGFIKVIISTHTDVDFCFAGSKSENNQEVLMLSAFDNFHYMGKLGKDELNACLKIADVMLLAYKADEYPEQLANPHKTMEYLASGKVLVATYTDELGFLADKKLICMSRTNSDLPSLFSSVLKDLPAWNSPEKVSARKQYATDNTYDKQIDRIDKIMKG